MTAAAALIPVTIRPLDPVSASERQFVWETTTKVRWPRHPHGGGWKEWQAAHGDDPPPRWHEWAQVHGRQVEEWIDAGPVFVADSGGGLLLGFVIVGPHAGSLAVRMLYVKREFRGDGLGLRLLEGLPSPILAELPTPSWSRWCARRGLRWEEVKC